MKMMVTVLAVLLLAACGHSNHIAEQAAAASAANAALEKMAEAAISSHLRDPSSAQFTITTVQPVFDTHWACGTVNSKNGFGGYAGAKTFVVMFKTEHDASVMFGSDAVYDLAVAEQCKILANYTARGIIGAPPTPAQMHELTSTVLDAVKKANDKLPLHTE